MEPNKRERTDYIVVHCAATKPDMDVGVKEIDAWHRAPPNNWNGIGYHLVIRRSGVVEAARPLDAEGIHVKGFNHKSVSVCLVGGLDPDGEPMPSYTGQQWQSLLATLRFLRAMYPEARIQGHNNFPNVKKACPSFDVRDWLVENAADLM